MPDTQPLPTPGEIAAMDSEELNRLAGRAMGWSLADIAVSPEWSPVWSWQAECGHNVRAFSYWKPAESPANAIELAEKVISAIPQFGFTMSMNRKLVSPGYFYTIKWKWPLEEQRSATADNFALALTRAACHAWAEWKDQNA